MQVHDTKVAAGFIKGKIVFGYKTKVSKVYKKLNEVKHLIGTKTAEEIYPVDLIKEHFKYTSHIETVVAMILLIREESVSEGYYKELNYEGLIREIEELSKTQKKSFEEIYEYEVNGMVETASKYGEYLAHRFDSGELDNSPEVREYCANYCAKMLSNWMIYRMRMRDTAVRLGLLTLTGEKK